MPSVKRGFVFKYFDKIICGLVALALLAAVIYAVTRAGAVPKQIQPQTVSGMASAIEQKLRAPAQPMPVEIPSPAQLEKVAQPPSLRPHMIIWPLPVLYYPIKVGLGKDFVLQFKAPLGEGTVSVQAPQGQAPPVDVIEHPVDGDYSKVKLHSRAYIGSSGPMACTVIGYEGRIAHIYPVIVDESVNKTAYAPTLTVAGDQGTAKLKIVEDPRIAQEGVVVAYYEIWRRAWSDPLGKYDLIDGVTPSGKPLSGGKATAGAPAAAIAVPPAMGGFAAAGATGAAAEPGISYTDTTVKAGDGYSYKVRAIGNNTFPTEGDFCQPVMVQVLPDVDFRFTLGTADSVSFDVIRAVGAEVKREKFWEGAGDAIGGEKNGEDYVTGYALVDYQPDATQGTTPGLPGRVIYADDKGNLRELWSGETKAEDLWNRLKAAPTTPANIPGRVPFGYRGIPRGVPYGRPAAPGGR